MTIYNIDEERDQQVNMRTSCQLLAGVFNIYLPKYYEYAIIIDK